MALCNGWANYATWRVSLEVFDGASTSDLGFDGLPLYELQEALKEYVEEIVCPFKKGENSLAENYALAFLSDVNWYEIAKNLRNDEDAEREEEEEEEEEEVAALEINAIEWVPDIQWHNDNKYPI